MRRAIKIPNDIRLSFCENDAGKLTKRVSNVEVEWPTGSAEQICLHLEAHSWHCGGEPIDRNDRLIWLYGYSFKYATVVHCVGNVMWNEYSLPNYYAVGLLNVLMHSGEWSVLEGYTDLTDKWNTKTDLTLADFGFADYPEWMHTGYGFHEHGIILMLFTDGNEANESTRERKM